MAKCFDVVGYIEPCNAVRQKYTGRALMITGTNDNTPIVLTFSDNGMKVSQIGGVNNLTELSNLNKFPLSINAENPFGVTVQGNIDSGRVMYTKTIPVSIPATRDGKPEEFIMGLQKGLNTAMIVLEPSDALDYGEVFGAYSPVRIDPTSVTRSEYENGGAWQFNIVCEEPVPNVIFSIEGLSETIDGLKA